MLNGHRDLITPHHEGPLASSMAGNHCWGLLQPQRIARVGRDSAAKAHLLVCAPSNSALDEIVLRILKTGLMDKDGNMWVVMLDKWDYQRIVMVFCCKHVL